MRATLEFILPDETAEHTLTLAAGDLAASLARVAAQLRNRLHNGALTEDTRIELEDLKMLVNFELLERVGY